MRRLVVGTAALVGAWVFTVVMYPKLDPRVPIHWNIRFEPDDYAPRVVVLVIAFAWLALPAVAILLSRIDPRGGGHNRDPKSYWTIWNALLCFLAAVQAYLVAAGAGWDVSGSRVFPTFLGLFLIVIGNLEPRLRPNWFVGTRTPWTLTSDEVWRRTHRFGGRVSVVGGALLVVGAWLPVDALRPTVWVAGFVLVIALPVAYSYVVWRRLGRPRPSASVS